MTALESTTASPYLDGVMGCLQELQEPKGWAFALLDSARDTRIHDELLRSGLKSVCVFKGRFIPDVVERAAPRLVNLEWGLNDFTEWMLSEGWGKGWCVLGRTQIGMLELRKHLRRYTVIMNPQGKSLYFRFHDPRVLRVFLPTCTSAQLTEFFGPVQTFLAEGPDPSEAWRLELGQAGELEHSRHLLV